MGGTETRDWQEDVLLHFLKREQPGHLIVYVGSNDIPVREEESIKENLFSQRKCTAEYDGKMGFAYFTIIKAPGKRDFWDKIERINSSFRNSLAKDALFYDTDRVFLRNGQLRDEFFQEDLTHHPPEAYGALADDSAPALAGWLDSRG